MEGHRKTSKQRARSPNVKERSRGSPEPPEGYEPAPALPGTEASLTDVLECIASPVRLAVLAALGRRPAGLDDIRKALGSQADQAEICLWKLGQCTLVEHWHEEDVYALTHRAEADREGDELVIRASSADGATVRAQLPLNTSTGRVLARAWESRGEQSADNQE